MDLGLKGKNVIVTGGASNIGRAITLGFADEGTDVIVADLDEGQSQHVVEQARDAKGRVVPVTTDVTDPTSVERMVATTPDRQRERRICDVIVS